METIKNMTPHPINVVNGEGKNIRIIPNEGIIRLKTETSPAGKVDGIPLTKTVFGVSEGLPEFQEGVFLIVSQLVKNALPERKDLIVPAEVVRDEKGNIIGCKSFGI